MRYLTEEEWNVASHFLFLSIAISIMEQDIQSVEKDMFKIKEPYFHLIKQMTFQALQERKPLRKKMKEKEIQVVSLEKSSSFSSYLFICQGREEKRNYFNPAMRKKVEAITYELIIKAQQSYSRSFGHPDT